jgi:hypothetical protein
MNLILMLLHSLIIWDTEPPETTIDSGPLPLTNQTSATFVFSASEDGVTYQCALDNAPGHDCAGEFITFSNLSEGAHTFSVYAVDGFGNQDLTPAVYNWVIDVTPPETSFASVPPSRTNQPRATFQFSSSEDAVSYVCRLDGNIYAVCSPGSISNAFLAEGPHTLMVSAVDAAGNLDPTPAVYTWVVDLRPPTTTIISQPPGITNASAAYFRMNSNEHGVIYMCRLDDLPLQSSSGVITYDQLSEGVHTFQAYAIDEAGNEDPTPVLYEWTVDTVPPETIIVTSPPGTTNQPNAIFQLASPEEHVSYECALDSGHFEPCSDYITYSSLDEGSHTLIARAHDPAGNVDATPAEHTWTVDFTAPTTVFTAVPPLLTRSAACKFIFSSPSQDVANYECSLNQGEFLPCGTTLSLSLTDGSYTLLVRAYDVASNVESVPATYSWTVDTTPPTAPQVTEPVMDSLIPAHQLVFAGKTEPAADIFIYIGDSLLGAVPSSTTGDWIFRPPEELKPGNYALTTTTRDAAGNISPASITVHFTVEAPQGPAETQGYYGWSCSSPPSSGMAGAWAGIILGSCLLGHGRGRRQTRRDMKHGRENHL